MSSIYVSETDFELIKEALIYRRKALKNALKALMKDNQSDSIDFLLGLGVMKISHEDVPENPIEYLHKLTLVIDGFGIPKRKYKGRKQKVGKE